MSILVTRRDSETRRIRYLSTGAVKLHCQRGSTTWHLRADLFAQGELIYPPLFRFGFSYGFSNGRHDVNTRLAGRIGRHHAHGRIGITGQFPKHGTCKSGKRRWTAHHG